MSDDTNYPGFKDYFNVFGLATSTSVEYNEASKWEAPLSFDGLLITSIKTNPGLKPPAKDSRADATICS